MRLLLLAILFIPTLVFAQLDEDYEYNKEFVWGPNKNTNGGTIGSVTFKWSRSIDNDWFRTFGFELSNVKHNKETKVTSQTGQSFIIGKTNYLYVLRLQYGREKLLFRKDSQQGVQINAGFMGGPSIGFHAPYYIQTRDGNYEKYDPYIHGISPIGPGRLFQGFGQGDKLVGAHVKGSLSFEFGTYKNNVAGIELGIMIEAYTRKVIIMPTQKNDAIFPSAFIAMYWGRRK